MHRFLLLIAVSVLAGLLAACSSPNREDSSRTYLRLEPGDGQFAAFPSEFDEFAIYWVGEAFGGHELRRIIREITPAQDILRGDNAVRFIYGTCEIVGEGGCPPPLQIIIQPYCVVPPELVGNGARPSGMETRRGGAESVVAGGGIRLWTGDVTIKVYATGSSLMEATIAALTSPNGLGVSAGEDMLPPSAECPPYETPDVTKLNN